MRPLNSYVLIRPIKPDPFSLEGYASPRPISGFVFAVGSRVREAVEVGDFVVWEDTTLTQPDLLQDTFFIRLRDSQGLHIVRADADIEPVIREAVQRYEKRGENQRITCHDLDREGEPVRFHASEILDYGIGSYTETGYNLSYANISELDSVDTGLSHDLYLVPESELLFRIPRANLSEP